MHNEPSFIKFVNKNGGWIGHNWGSVLSKFYKNNYRDENVVKQK